MIQLNFTHKFNSVNSLQFFSIFRMAVNWYQGTQIVYAGIGYNIPSSTLQRNKNAGNPDK